MTAPNDRAIEALRELVALKDMKDAGWGSQDTETEDAYLARKPAAWSEARAALAAVDAQTAEPVRLLVACMFCGHKNYVSEDEAARNPVVAEPAQELQAWIDAREANISVYGNDPTPPTPRRQPLNFDQLQSVMAAHFGAREMTDDEADSAEAFARAVERAHDIGAGA